jgi:hypothetical protein
MLAFRGGRWIEVPYVATDPMLTTSLQQRVAAAAATRIAKGEGTASAISKAEADLYKTLFDGSQNSVNTVNSVSKANSGVAGK